MPYYNEDPRRDPDFDNHSYIYRILNMSPKKELLWGLGVGLRAERLQVDLKVSVLFLMTFYQYEKKSICA